MTIVIRAELRPLPGRHDAFRTAALALRDRAAQEPGTLRYDWYEGEAPSTFALAHNELCADLLRESGATAEMTAVHLYGDLGPVLTAWVAEHEHARVHRPL